VFVCSRCGQTHPELPLCYGAEAPYYYYAIPEAERASRVLMDDELCVIDEQHFFIKGRILLPVIGHDEPFVWLAWVSLSRENFHRTVDLWEKPGRENEAAYFGWLSTELSVYPSTLNLRTAVQTMPVGERPVITVLDDHPLAQEQRQGITWRRVQEIAENLLHP
jgi:hypothetical protein